MGCSIKSLSRNPFFYQILSIIFAITKGLVSIKLLVLMGNVEYVVVTQIAVFAAMLYQVSIFSFDGPFVKSAINSLNSEIYSFGLNIVTYVSILFFLTIGLLVPEFYMFRMWGSEIGIIYVYFFMLYSTVYILSCRNLIYFQSQGDLISYAKYQLLQYSGQLLSIIIGFVYNSLELVLVMMIMFELLLLLIGVKYSRQIFYIRSVVKPLCWLRENFEMALALILSVLAIWLINNNGRLIIPHLGNLEQLTVYGVSMSIALLGGVFINPFCAILFPVLAKNDKIISKKNKTFIGLFVVSVITFLSTLFILFFSSELQLIISKAELFPGYIFYSLSACTFILLGNSRVYSLFFITNNSVRKSSGMYLLNASLTFFLCIALFQYFSVLAIPLSMLIGVVLSQIFYFNEIKYIYYENPYSRIRYSGSILNLFVIAALFSPLLFDNASFIFKLIVFIGVVFIYFTLILNVYHFRKLSEDFQTVFFKR